VCKWATVQVWKNLIAAMEELVRNLRSVVGRRAIVMDLEIVLTIVTMLVKESRTNVLLLASAPMMDFVVPEHGSVSLRYLVSYW